MAEKRIDIPGFPGTFVFPSTTSSPRIRPSLFPTRDQVAELAGLPLPQPRPTAQSPQVVSIIDAAELEDFKMVDAPSPLESAPVDSDNEPSLPPATVAPQHSSSFRTPTVPRPEGYTTPPHGPSFLPITPPVQLAIGSDNDWQEISSLDQTAPVAAINPPESALRFSLFRTPTVPLPEGYETLPHEMSRSPIAPPTQPAAENDDTSHNLSFEEPAVSPTMDEPTAPQASPDTHDGESDNEEDSEYEVWDDAPALPPENLERINTRAQGRSPFPLLRLPPRAIHRILDLLLVYDEPIALVRKGPDRRIVEANKSHVLTVGQGKITREPQNKRMKSNVARTINTASPTNLFLVCRALRNLGIKTYYNKNTFAFSSEQGLAGWAASIGSRRNEVKKVELRSGWEVVFKGSDIYNIRREDLNMTAGKGVLYTAHLRVFRSIERIDVDIALRMPWQCTGKLPEYDKFSPDAQKMCFEFGKWMARGMFDRFRRLELNTPFIAKHLHIWFDKAWVEDHYKSAWLKQRRVAERAAKASSSKDL